MELDNLIDIHLQELREKIHQLERQAYLANIHLQKLSELLLDGIEKLILDIYVATLDQIKSNKIRRFNSSDEIISLIDNKVKCICPDYECILQNAALKAFKKNVSVRNEFLAKLDFKAKYERTIKILYSKLQAEYMEFLNQKTMEEIRLAIEKESLEKAEEANCIAKSSKRASWGSCLIALAALIVSYLAFRK